MLDPKDLRIDAYRDGSVYWRGTARIVHLPTGETVSYDCAWNDREGSKARALAELEAKVLAAEPPNPPTL